jgi:hypothetical protein
MDLVPRPDNPHHARNRLSRREIRTLNPAILRLEDSRARVSRRVSPCNPNFTVLRPESRPKLSLTTPAGSLALKQLKSNVFSSGEA